MSATAAPGGSSFQPSPVTGTPAFDPAVSLRKARGRYGEKVTHGLLAGSAGLTVLITLSIFFSLLLPALDFFSEVSVWDFLTGTRWAPTFGS